MEAQFIQAHERLIDEYLKAHPGATWEAAFEITADEACDQCIAEVVDLAGAARRRAHSWRRGAH
jgi:hypothetical protein